MIRQKLTDGVKVNTECLNFVYSMRGAFIREKCWKKKSNAKHQKKQKKQKIKKIQEYHKKTQKLKKNPLIS
jgi:hypothetical protein